MKSIRVFLLSLVCLPLFAVDPLPIPQTGDTLQLRLIGALESGGSGRVLMLEFQRWKDHWFTGTGYSPSYNKGSHRAILLNPDLTSGTLHVLAQIDGDAWVPGGAAEYHLTLREEEPGVYQGTYMGTFRGAELTGEVEGQWIPASPSLPGMKPASRGQHPRLLLQENDLPALRTKAGTEFGKRALETFPKSAVGLGMLYQLHGETAYADRARVAVEAHMADLSSGSKMIRHRFWAYRLEQIAIAYDLCYHAWPEDFRKEVQEYIHGLARRMYRQRGAWTEYMSWNPDSAYTATTLYSGLIGMLAVVDQSGPEPKQPVAPPSELPAIAPLDEPGESVGAVSPFQSGEMPDVWAYSGPLGKDQMDAWKEAMGNPASLADHVESWRMLTKEEGIKGMVKNKYSGNRWTVEMNKASGTAFDSWNMIHARVEVKEPRTVRYQSQHGGTEQFLNGQWLNNGDLIRLEPGLYDLAVACPIGRPNPWAGIFVRPRFEEQTPEQVKAVIDAAQKRYERETLFWKQEHADWEALGEIDMTGFFLLQDAAFWYRRMEEKVFGQNGAQVGATHALLMEGTAPMSTVYRNVTGRPLGAANGLSRWVPAKLMAMSFDENQQAVAQPFWGQPDFRSLGYQDKRDLARIILPQHFPSVDPGLQALVLWYWKSLGDPLGGAGLPEADRLLAQDIEGGSYDSKAVYAFLYLPEEMEPQEPAKALPLAWSFPNSGRFIFRNRWQDHEDVVIQLSAQQQDGHVTFSKAGAFALRGLGHDWTFPNSYGMRSVGERMGETVVQTLLPAQNSKGRGRVLASEILENGSGWVRMDLSEVYRMRKPGKKNRYPHPYDRGGGGVNEAILAEETASVQVTRDVLVDVSGDAGVPLVMVVRDRLSGVENSVWSWPLDLKISTTRGKQKGVNNQAPYDRTPSAFDGIEVDGSQFRIRKEGAVLGGTFLLPEKPEVAVQNFTKKMVVPKSTQVRTYTCLTASGGEDFLAVMTLDESELPTPTLTRKGEVLLLEIGGARYQVNKEGLQFLP